VEQGKNGFYEAFFEGETNTDKFSNGSSTVAIEWLMRHGTFVANDSWSPNDMVTRSGTLKAGELIKLVDGYDGTGSYNDAKNG
jgi:hypothetical protein